MQFRHRRLGRGRPATPWQEAGLSDRSSGNRLHRVVVMSREVGVRAQIRVSARSFMLRQREKSVSTSLLGVVAVCVGGFFFGVAELGHDIPYECGNVDCVGGGACPSFCEGQPGCSEIC